MKYITIVLFLIAVAVAAFFIIEHSDVWLIVAIVAIIAGFWKAVFTIPNED